MTTVVTRNGACAERLRAGGGETLLIVPGREADPAELIEVTTAFTGPLEIYALTPSLTDDDGRAISSVERIAELMVPVVRELSPSGSHRIAGYSFGALIALEVSRQLRAAGDSVEALFLIEAVYDERFWPRRTWLTALARRTGRHLLRIAHLPPRDAFAELDIRARRVVGLMLERRRVDDGPPADTDVTSMSSRAYSAKVRYRPRFYDGPLTLIAASDDRHFGCDTVDLWLRRARQLSVQRVDGDHLSILRSPRSAAAVAHAIEHGLQLIDADWAGIRPMPGFERPMILTTVRWFSAARLAHALSEAGFTVSACRPRGHPLDLVDALDSTRRLHKLWPLRSIAAAIRSAKPDLIICDDESSLALLRRLHTRVLASDPAMATLLARSLGNVEDWPAIASRTQLAREAGRLGLATPDTAVVGSVDELQDWVTRHDMPVVLKTDGSWGGRGVDIVYELGDLADAWRRLSRPPGFLRAAKRAVFDHEMNTLVAWRRRERPSVNVQQFCPGRDAIVTTASVGSEVAALVCMEVIQASEMRGPAAVVRIIDHPQMAETARQLIRRFELSGFCGFDFMVDDSGNAQLLELNPRVTPTAHLLAEGGLGPTRTLGLFPFELFRAPETSVDMMGILDLPTRAPILIEHGTKLAARRQRRASRAMRYATQLINGPARARAEG